MSIKRSLMHALVLLLMFSPSVLSLSNPLALQPDLTYQTGTQILITSSFTSTVQQVFSIPYTSVMTTGSLNATLGLYGVNYYTINPTFGWKIFVSSVTSSNINVHLSVVTASSPIYYLKVSYLISCNPDIDINYVEYTFDATMPIANQALGINGTCSIDCRTQTRTQTYSNKPSSVVKVFLAGFKVASFGGGFDNYFGLNLNPTGSSTTSFTLDITVYGLANVVYVSYFYLSYGSVALNVLYKSTAMIGHSALGCYYPNNVCGFGSISNTNFNTGLTSVLAYTSSMFFMGIDSMIVMYSGTTAYKGEFDVTSVSQNADTSVKVNFAFTGNALGAFSVGYSYFTFQTFYCPPGGPDYYFVYGSNMCDSACNSSISQFMNASNICQPCAPQCYKCIGTSSFCTACYNSQNRVLNGNNCACDSTASFYDDGTSLVCPQCHYSCLTCNGASSGSCITCDSTSKRYKVNNTCPCILGYYDANANVCVQCHYTCQSATCTGTSSTTCSSCNPAKFRANVTSGNACPCTNGYYDNSTSSELCSPCHYSCLTCTTTNVYCVTCDSTKFRSINNPTHTCPCNSAYYDSGVSLCMGCDSTCLTCSGGLSVNCLTCDASVRRTKVVTSCPCANYYYDLNKTCTSCYYSCLTCTNNTSTGCSNCDGTSFRTFKATTGQCLCNFGYVDMGVLVCQVCSASCLSCIYNTTACASCHNNTGRYQAGYSCLCQPGYVDLTFNGICTACHYSCVTCFSGTSTGCSTCSNNRTLSGNACLCPTGQYDNGFSVICQPCHVNCLNCTTGLSSGCTACNLLYYRTLNPSPTGTCICQGGYYEVSTLICANCDPKCLTCVTTATSCTSCDNSTNRRAITANLTCDCIIGYFQTGATPCSACIATCYKCITLSSTCTACFSDRYLLNSTCYCIPGTFQNLAGSCSPCSPACLTCVNSSTTCLTCPANANRYQFGTTCPCNSGFYDSGVAVCPQCNYTCFNCSTLYTCVTCPTNSYRTLTMANLCPCNSGYYDNGNIICAQCSLYCLTCVTYSQCQSCNSTDNRIWNSLTLTCPCQAAFYDNGVNTTCSACHYSCATCFAGLSTNCYTCPSLRVFTMPYSCPCIFAYYQAGGVCTPCSIACRTCSVLSTNCTSCPSTSYLSNYQCLCLQGYFLNGLTCQVCDVRCQWCTVTATNCQTCNPLHGTYINGSSCICNSNQYQNNVTLVCTSCSLYCLTCTSNTNTSCLSCYSYMSRTYSPIYRTCDCTPGFYDSGILNCSACASPCATCNGGTNLNCTSCIAGYTLIGSSCVPITTCSNYYYNGVCVNTCPNTTYYGANICITCINNCLTCTSISACTSCLLTFYLYGGTCYALCPVSTYYDTTQRICSPCPVACYECSMRNFTLVCQSCNTNYYLLNYQCINITNCPITNKTYVLVSNMCKPCLYECATCSNLTVNGCITCNKNFNYYLGMCLAKCPQGFYALSQSCVVCIANCTSCTTIGCSTCVTGFYLTSSYQCVPIGSFLKQGSITKCHPNCLTCTDSSFSSCILCSKDRGDASSKAISGYCDCWTGSIDLGNGLCDVQLYKPVQKANEALVSATTSLNYLSALTGVICVNYFAPTMIVSYQQLYSNFYYLNSSSTLQTDEVLNKYGDTCFNRLMEKQSNKNVKKYSKAFGRRLQSGTQQQQSLFMRGYSWRYLVDWGFYTFICIVVAWLMVIMLAFIFARVKLCVDKEHLAYKIINGIVIIFRENIIIVIHLLTINDVSFYALASFKLLPTVNSSYDPLLLAFSIIMFAYYVLYLLRLFVAGIKFVGSQQQENQFMVLFSCFYSYKKRQALCRIYVPMMMLRSFIISFALVFLAFNPVGQIVTALLLFIAFTIYSFLYCPYYFYLSIFVHIFQGLFILQLLLLTISVAQPDASKIGPAFGLIVLNYLQLLSFLVLTISVILNKIYDIKCWQLKQKRILPFKKESENEQIHVPVYKQRNPVKIFDDTVEDIQPDDPDDEKMDNDILKALQRRPIPPNRSSSNNLNDSFQPAERSQVARRRRKEKETQVQHVDIFSLQDMEETSQKQQKSRLRPRNNRKV